MWLHQTIHIQSIQSDLSLERERLWFYSLCLLLNEHEAKLPAVMYVITHSTDNDAVFQTQRLPQDSKLLCDLIGQLPTWHHRYSIISWEYGTGSINNMLYRLNRSWFIWHILAVWIWHAKNFNIKTVLFEYFYLEGLTARPLLQHLVWTHSTVWWRNIWEWHKLTWLVTMIKIHKHVCIMDFVFHKCVFQLALWLTWLEWAPSRRCRTGPLTVSAALAAQMLPSSHFLS